MNRLITQYGLALVFANVLLEQIGLPIPAVPTLIVAGALAAEGELSPLAIFGVAFVACSVGDALWYVAGRRYGRRVMKLLCRVSLSPDSCVRQTEVRFDRWGGLALVLSKFIPGLSTIAPPLAGAMRLGWPSFLLLNSLGVVIWAGIAIAAGMAFHAQINELVLGLEDLGTLAIEIIAVLLGGYIALKWWERRRFYNMLRIARIGVDELRALVDGGKRPVVVDVRYREIVFYCTCPNEASAATVAKKLIGLGYTRVRPLHGGLDAWIEAGYDVERRTGKLPS